MFLCKQDKHHTVQADYNVLGQAGQTPPPLQYFVLARGKPDAFEFSEL